MKGTKGMQNRVFLFLVFFLCILNNASSLEARRTEASLNGASGLSSNVATINDMVWLKPNEAFLPSEEDAIVYEISSVNDDSINMSKEFGMTSTQQRVNKNTEISKKIDTPVKQEKQLSSLKAEDKVKIVSKTDTAKKENKTTSSKKQKNIDTTNSSKKTDDKFSNIKVEEGEEVLVFMSPSKIDNKKSDTSSNITISQNEQKVDNVPTNTQPSTTSVVASADTNPFGVIVSNTNIKEDEKTSADKNPFVRAFSALRPEKISNTNYSNKKKQKEKTLSYMNPELLKKDLHRTYLSDNQYLSPVESFSDEYADEYLEDEAQENFENQSEAYAEEYADDTNFSSQRNVKDALEGDGPVDINEIKEKIQTTKKMSNRASGPLKAGTREVLEMKIDFQDGSSAVSGESVNLIRSFAQVATDQPTNSIEITIPESVMSDIKKKKLTARRLSIVSNILRNAGISDKQIKPVLSNRDEDSFAFRIISNDEYTTFRVSKGVDMFGEEENVKEYNVMKW